MAASLGIVLVTLFLSYKQYPIRTVMSIRQESSIAVPSFTFCLQGDINMSKLKSSPILYDYISKTRSTYPLRSFFDSEKDMYDYLNRTRKYLSQMTAAEFAEKSAFSLHDFVLFIIVNYNFVNGLELESFLTPVFHPFQSCWKLTGSNRKEDTLSVFEELSIIFNLHAADHHSDVPHVGLEFYAHEIQQTHLLQNPLYIRPGTFATVMFSATEHRYLPLPYRSFGDEGCLDVDGEGFQNPLKITPKYYRISCLVEFLLETLVNQCGCIEQEHQYMFPNVSICTFIQVEECHGPLYRSLYATFFDQNRLSEMGCLSECSFTTYDMSLSSATFPSPHAIPFLRLLQYNKSIEEARENLVYLRIKPKEASVRLIEHVPDITLLSIFGTVGGFMGLFLGASVLSLVELLETILCTVWLMIAKIKRIVWDKTMVACQK